MATPEDLENRLRAVEREVVRLREQTTFAGADAVAARMLAAGADRDVSEVRAELRAHVVALNALRETQIENGRRLDQLEDHVSRLEARVAAGFDGLGGRLATIEGGNAQILTLLERLVDDR